MDELGRRIREARRRKYGSVEAAIRAAGVNRGTWIRAEEGHPVRDESLSKIEASLGWPDGYAFRLADGEDPDEPVRSSSSPSDPIRDAIEKSSLSDHDKTILLAQLDVMRANQPEPDNGSEDRRFA